MLSSFIAATLCAATGAVPPDLVPQVDPVTGLGAFRGSFSDSAPTPFVPLGTIGLERAPGLTPADPLEPASSLIVSWGERPIEYILEMPLSHDSGESLEVVAMLDAWAAQLDAPTTPVSAARFFVSAAGASSDGLERAVMGFVNNERSGRSGQIRFVPSPGAAALLAGAALAAVRRRRA